MADPQKELEAMGAALSALQVLDSDGRQRAMSWLSDALGTPTVASPLPTPPAPAQQGPASSGAETSRSSDDNVLAMTPKAFIAAKQPQTDVERLTCLAYYLTKARDTPEFSTKDLTSLNTEAAGRRFSNPTATGKNATGKSGYLAGAAGKKRQITHLGEQVVEALPDREALKAILSAAPKQRKKRSRAKAKKTNKA